MADKEQCLRDDELAFFQKNLNSFVPDKVFDAHAHLWRSLQYPQKTPSVFGDDVTCEDHRRILGEVFVNRQIGGWCLPKPILRKKETDALLASEWISQCVKDQSFYRGAYLVRPGDDPDTVRQDIKRLGLKGYKCYHVFANRPDTVEADIPEYLPENLMKVADEESLIVTLHMVKSRALADESNIHWIRHYCKTYPNMKMILAHSARAFQPDHNFEGLDRIADLDNVFFDISANCEPMAHQSIMRIIGHHRLMYGSDFGLASHSRGRSLSAADTFLWLYDDTPVWKEKHTTIKPLLIMLESLRSLKWACWSERLTDTQVENVFWNNAAELFEIR